MAVVPRKRKDSTTYYVTFQFQGRAVWERSGSDRREAERLNARRKRELAAGTYEPDPKRRAPTVGQYAETWGEKRTNSSAKDDRRNLSRFTSDKALAAMPLEDVRPRHIIERLKALSASGGFTDKTLQNAYGTFRTMCRDAVIEEVIVSSPCVLPRKFFDTSEQAEREPYTPAELVVLIRHAGIDPSIRVLNALCLLAGLREGEACGRRWKDLDLAPGPLPCLDVRTQYDGKPLKTRRPRVVPVHPELRAVLADWAERGFEEMTCRKPTPEDFIVPRLDRRGRVTHHTKSTYYKAFQRACRVAGIRARSLHSTRHTFVTLCRRGGCDVAALSVVTHNARGAIVDRYTHRAWQELCDVVLCLRLDARLDPRRTLTSPRENSPAEARTGTPLLKEAESSQAPDPSSIPGASTLNPAKTSQTAKQRQDSRQDNRSAPVSFRALSDFEIALAESSERGEVGRLLCGQTVTIRDRGSLLDGLPAVARIALHRRCPTSATAGAR